MQNETQTELIRLITGRLEKIEIKIDKVQETAVTKRDLDRIIESQNRRLEMVTKDRKEQQVQIDNHCARIRQIEKEQAIFGSEFEPVKNAYNKIASALVGFCVVVGVVVISLVFFLKDKIK